MYLVKILNINSQKALKKLKWKPKLTINQSVNLTVDWYRTFKKKGNLFKLTENQIKNYFKI